MTESDWEFVEKNPDTGKKYFRKKEKKESKKKGQAGPY